MACQRSTAPSLSCPSVKQCASMRTGSPAMRLAANLPPSTTGKTASTTARARPSARGLISGGGALRCLSAMTFPAQHDRRQRGYVEGQRVESSVGTHWRGFYAPQIAPSRTTVLTGIAVEDFAPQAAVRNAQQKIAVRNRREIGDDQHGGAVHALAYEGGHAHLPIVRIDPFEAVRPEVDLVQRGLIAVDTIQVPNPAANAGMLGAIGHPPLEFPVMRPFPSLAELP